MKHLFVLSILAAGLMTQGIAPAAEKILREDTEWLEISIPGLHKTGQPHVLLIGDSITSSYYWAVAEKLKGRAIVAKMATSKSVGDPALLTEISYVLSQCKFDVVHFNNGMHGREYTEEDFREYFPGLIECILKGVPEARLIWATITPTREREKLEVVEAFTARVKERNRIAGECVAKAGIPTNDLYALVEKHTDYFGDGVHFNEKGIEAQAAEVARCLGEALEQKK